MANIIEFERTGGTKNFEYEISCEAVVTFKKIETDSWYNISLKDDNKVEISIDTENTTNSERESVITPSVDDVECGSNKIKIIQKTCECDDITTDATSIITIQKSGGTRTFNYTSQCENAVNFISTPTQDWCEISVDDSNKQVTITVTEAIADRETIITPFVNNKPCDDKTIKLIQKTCECGDINLDYPEQEHTWKYSEYGYDNRIEIPINGKGDCHSDFEVNSTELLNNNFTANIIDNNTKIVVYPTNPNTGTKKEITLTFSYKAFGEPCGTINSITLKQGIQADYLTFIPRESGSFSFTNNVNFSRDNGITWNTLNANNPLSVDASNVIKWKANLTANTNNGIGTFSSTGEFDVSGNPMSLLYGDNFDETTSLGANYAFKRLLQNCNKLINAENLKLTSNNLTSECYKFMFSGCTSLKTAPSLPATILADSCYENMFSDCVSLTEAPILSSTTLGVTCYKGMFSGCTALTTVQSELSATTAPISCYNSMFMGCKSLTTAPSISATSLAFGCCQGMFIDCTALTTTQSILPATTLGEYCYYSMFSGCTSLTTAPVLSAKTLAKCCCMYMFNGCTALTTVQSELSATTLADNCYENMFQNCKSLTRAPELPATTLPDWCYAYMFQGCTSLTTVPSTLPATTVSRESCRAMFNGCTALRTAPSLPATTLGKDCYSFMFQGCTSLTTAPSTLPATTLASSCYYYMFNGCTNLTTAPELPAITLAELCYAAMFQNCSSLNYVKAMFTTTPSDSYTNLWLYGVSRNGTFVKNSAATWDCSNISDYKCIPSAWTVQTASS